MHSKNKILLLLLALAIISAGLANSARAGSGWQGPPPPGTVDKNGFVWGPPVDMDAAEDVSNKYETDEDAKKYARPADAIEVILNSVQLDFVEAWPYINKDGRVMIPVRKIAEALQATVNWDQATKTVSFYRPAQKFQWGGFKDIERSELTVTLKIGEKSATVNGQVIDLDTQAELKNGRTLVPLRFVAENFNATVEWMGPVKTVNIDFFPAPYDN